MSRFDCACDKGHRMTLFVAEPPSLCPEWRWEPAPGAVLMQRGDGSRYWSSTIPVACGAMLDVVHAPRAGEAA